MASWKALGFLTHILTSFHACKISMGLWTTTGRVVQVGDSVDILGGDKRNKTIIPFDHG